MHLSLTTHKPQPKRRKGDITLLITKDTQRLEIPDRSTELIPTFFIIAQHLLANRGGPSRLNFMLVPEDRHPRRARAVVQERPPVTPVSQHRHESAFPAIDAARDCSKGENEAGD